MLRFVLALGLTSGGSRPGVWGGGIEIRGSQKIFPCLNTPASLRQWLGITQKFETDILRNVIVSGYVIFYQMKKFSKI